MLNVVCVLWEGDFRKRTYNSEWVIKLKRMVERNLTVPFNFYCLSNVDIPTINTIPLKHNYPGWWSKIELFRSDLPIEGRILYIDLDSLIINNLDDLVNFDSKFVLVPPYPMFTSKTPYPVKSWSANNPHLYGRTIRKYNNPVMVFDKGQGYKIYTKFSNNIMEDFRGDQDWIGYLYSNLDTFPNKWFCKLRNYLDKKPPNYVKVVFCNPYKNDQASELFPWVKKIWR